MMFSFVEVITTENTITWIRGLQGDTGFTKLQGVFKLNPYIRF